MITCCCADPYCKVHGCRLANAARYNEDNTPGAPKEYSKPQTQGCICPPTSEQTCQNQYCPRKPVLISVTTEIRTTNSTKTLLKE